MANSPSAKKRIRQTVKRTLRNKVQRSRVRTAAKQVEARVEQGDMEAAEQSLQHAYKIIDKAAKAGVLHKNSAARRKSRLARLVQRASSETA